MWPGFVNHDAFHHQIDERIQRGQEKQRPNEPSDREMVTCENVIDPMHGHVRSEHFDVGSIVVL